MPEQLIMNYTLHELRMKFIVIDKRTEEIVGAFVSATSANNCLNNNWNRQDYAVRETY